MKTLTLTLTCTVDAEDWEAFKAGTPDPAELLGCFEARLDEIYGDDGSVLTTVHAEKVEVK